MPLLTVIAGAYTGTYAAADVGGTEDGFRIRRTVAKELIRGDAYGESVIDAVYRGGDAFLTFVGLEYDDAVAVFWPYGGASGLHKMGVVGRMDQGSSLAGAVVLTDTDGLTAATKPATLTASQAIIDENFNQELIYANRARKCPVTLRLYPYLITADVCWFSQT